MPVLSAQNRAGWTMGLSKTVTKGLDGRIRFGAAYYFEYQAPARLDKDLDLMAAANFTVIRVGESVWSTWEPEDGRFELEWLRPVLDGAHARGIDVILGTPTYAIPPWLQRKHPQLAADIRTGQPMPWGGRQEVDYSSPLFHQYAERVIRNVVGVYANHPAVVGFQLDNEPGLLPFFNPHAFTEFVARLGEQYGDVDALNEEWGLTYWSHRLHSWDDLWTPDGNTSPQYDLAWRRYQADLTTEFIGRQAEVVRELARPDQFLTTCIAYPRPFIADDAVASVLDVTGANPYFGMQDHLALASDLPAPTSWTTSGVAGLLRQADRAFSSAQARFLVTETNAQSIGHSDLNQPPYPGQIKQSAFALVSRGAAMVEYWHWQTLQYGFETYWGGVLPHSQLPGRTYTEVAEVGAVLQRIGSELDGYVPDADVTLLWSNDSKWALEFFPPYRDDRGEPQRAAYEEIFDAFHRGVIDAGAQARIVHAPQLDDDPSRLAAAHPVLIVPAYYVASTAVLELLARYAASGGHLVLGIRTAYADDEARARRAVAPPLLAGAAGVWYDEFSSLDGSVPVDGSPRLPLPSGGAATRWIDGLVQEDAEVLARYEHPQFGRFPAITTRAHGAGRITYVGTVPDRRLAEAVARWLTPQPIAARWQHGEHVTVMSGSLPHGRRTWFVSNWSNDASTARFDESLSDLETGATVGAGVEISLAPWAARVFIGA